MKRIYYLYDGGNQPIVTVGIFKDEKGIAFARTLSIYGEGEINPLNKGQARSIVDDRFENAKEILKRASYINEIYPRRVEDLYYRLISPKNENRNVEEIFGIVDEPILKIDLEATLTKFEKHLLKIDDSSVNSENANA
ncbi:hypothetical protein KA005_63300 [bacterium]|nr:hypothetical protein [bacterium]